MFIADDPGEDYRLRWPFEIFAREAKAIARGPGWYERAHWLLLDAFDSEEPARYFASLPDGSGIWADSDGDLHHARNSLWDELVQSPSSLPEPRKQFRRYFPQRTDPPAPIDPLVALRSGWRDLIFRLAHRGYFDREFGTPCVDRPPSPSGQDALGKACLDAFGVQLHLPEIAELEENELYGAIEVAHDVIARPRTREEHDFSGCGFHYADFAIDPGQRIYRYHVNVLLDDLQHPLRLATDGDDAGLLISHVDDGRTDLIASATQITSNTGDEIRHAIAQFRHRAATREDRRLACHGLARVLEERRDLIADSVEFTKRDDGALFQLADTFDIRHANTVTKPQQTDYSDEFLDWIFWTFLASVELTERLLARAS
ncbi:MAG: hypothetical protein ACK5MR_15945 [Cumulibacter sp.]